MSANKLSAHPVHLGLGATAQREPVFTGEMSWYEGYGRRHGGDGVEGRLVSMHTFSESWDTWAGYTPKPSDGSACASSASSGRTRKNLLEPLRSTEPNGPT